MNNAVLYTAASPMQVRDARQALEEALLGGHMPRRGQGPLKVLDVGSGPGTLTERLLLPALPQDATIVGCDISEAMVKYANERYSGRRVVFRQADIADPHLARTHPWTRDPFDAIFSFYCLHWVQDQRTAAINMYNMLKPGGDILLVFLAKHPVFTLYEELGEMPKWKTYMRDVNEYLSPYQKSANAEVEYSQVLVGAEFVDVYTSVRDVSFEFDSMETVMKGIEAVNPFLERIPERMRRDYLDDIEAIIVDKRLADIGADRRASIDYKLMTARARKPLSS